MARLLLDENIAAEAKSLLAGLGHDVLTLADIGMSNRRMPDLRVLAEATRDGRAVVTLNRRDFIRLHMQNQDHAGIIVCTFDADTPGLVERIHRSIESVLSLEHRLVRVYRIMQ